MSLEEILSTAKPPKRGSTCHVEKVLNALKDKERELIVAALDNRDKFSSPMIVEVLRKHFANLPESDPMHGYEIGDSSVSRHRRGTCRCGK